VVEDAVTGEAREAVLERVRGALAGVPAGESPGDVPVERGYRHDDPAPREEILDRFAERVADYRVGVRRVRRDGVADAVRLACLAHGARRLVVPPDLPEPWRPEGVEALEDEALPHAELDAAGGALTGCALGIAETGTIVLDAGARQGRRALTLLPDLHICVVEGDQVVGSVPEAVTRLGAAVRDGRPLTFVSGPSATSDIELDRVEGVHGPRTLEVLVVAGA
jgi:L-lactate dehydrogenase complex protein LldG